MAAIVKSDLQGLWRGQCNFVKLQHAAVGIIQALNQQQRRSDGAAIRANVKTSKPF